MSKTVSARIHKDLHEELRERCNNIGCSINDFVAESVKFMLHNESDFDFDGENEEDEQKEPVKATLEWVPDNSDESTKVTKI